MNANNCWSCTAGLDVLDVGSARDKMWTFHWPGRVVIEALTVGIEWQPHGETRALPVGTAARTVLVAPSFAGHVRIFARAGASFRVLFEAPRQSEPTFYGRVQYPRVISGIAPEAAANATLELAAEALAAVAPDSVRIAANISRTRELLSRNLTEDMDLEALAAGAGVDRCHLCRSFQRAVGLPPYRFRAHLRVARARQLLASGHECTEVAHELGFCDQSHLTRTFKEMTGTTPGAYARACGMARASRPQLRTAA